jgi:hypothetical protein
MQPYFFPYLGHFALIAHTDQWIVFDTSQYTPRSWMSRNRVLHPQSGWTYVSAPLLRSSISLKTCQVQVDRPAEVRRSLLGKLSHYRRHAPYYRQTVALVEETFERLGNEDSLVALDVCGLAVVCDYLGLPFRYQICSHLGLHLGHVEGPGGWAPEIAHQYGAQTYVNPVSGKDLFDPADFRRHGIDLEFLEFSGLSYDTGSYGFEPGLSVLDVVSWCSVGRIRQALFEQTRISRVPAAAQGQLQRNSG